jgi:amino acid transporter
MNQPTPEAVANQRPGMGRMKRVLTRGDLILYGLVILTPTAPYPIYGIIQQESRGHAALSYLVAMVAMLFTAASYARMASAYPSAGSTYTYVQRTLGSHLGFLAGWAMILDYFLIPLESIIYAAITAARLIPAIPYIFWVLVFTGGITYINIRGIRFMSRANTALLTVMIGCAVLFLGLAARFIVIRDGIGGLISARGILPQETVAIHPVMLGAAIATLSYIGFDAISTLAEDTLHPKRDIGFSTVFVCALQTVICVLTVFLASLVWPTYQTFPQTETAILDVGNRIGGPFLFGLITFVLLVAGIASALTGQAGASRLLFAMGRDGVISRSCFAHLHPRFATPTRAVFVISLVSLTGALLMRFQIAVELLNFGAFSGFVLVNLSVIQHYFIRGRDRFGRGILFNLVFPLAGALVCSYVWMNLTLKAKIVGFVWLAVGAAYLGFITKGFKQPPKQLHFEEPE